MLEYYATADSNDRSGGAKRKSFSQGGRKRTVRCWCAETRTPTFKYRRFPRLRLIFLALAFVDASASHSLIF